MTLKLYFNHLEANQGIANGVTLLIMFVFLFYNTWKEVKYPFVIIWKAMKITTMLRKGVSLVRLFVMLYLQSWIAMHHQFVSIGSQSHHVTLWI